MDNDVNLKLGITFLNSGAEYTTEGVSDGNDKSFGTDIKLSGEYMYKVNNIFKMGIGLQIWHLAVNYTFSSGHNTNRSRTFMPLYASIQANPFNANKEFFLRGNLGYSVVYDNNYGDNEKGGMYYGISIGYEFKSGFIFEFAYEIYAYSYERLVMWDTTQDIDEYLGTTGINIGYKFKL
jgi:hypothetical protein